MTTKKLLIVALIAGLVIWFASGLLRDDAVKQTAAVPLAQVVVQKSKAMPQAPLTTLNGRTYPSKLAVIRAENDGVVEELTATDGALLEKGDPILRISVEDRAAAAAQAKARTRQRQIEFDAARRLFNSGYGSTTALATARANLDEAEAILKQANVDVGRVKVRAPYKGYWEARQVTVGDFVRNGDPLGQFAQLEPLYIEAQAASRQLVNIPAVNTPVNVALENGETAQGLLTYKAKVPDPVSNTFLLRVTVDNEGAKLPAGILAGLQLSGEPVMAHEISSAFLALNDAGDLGVKALGADNMVVFHPAKIIRSGVNGLWLAGLPETLDIITTGHEFVAEGEKVAPVFNNLAEKRD